MDLEGIRWGGMALIDIPQERDKWMAFVNKVMKLRVS
jgi:hypothetical protein